MNRPVELDILIEGSATAEATRRLAKRFAKSRTSKFYREFVDRSLVSTLGFGTYLGECDNAEDARYVATITAALERGVNLFDTAINYRCQRSERAIGEALRGALDRGELRRDEIVICSKGGYIPLDRTPPATKEGYQGFLQSEYYGPGVMRAEDVIGGGHCMTPRYISDQIERSKRNLGLACIDVYYLHNPEQQLDTLDKDRFRTLIVSAFAELEEHVRRGNIGTYGCATWNGFRTAPTARNHLELEDLCAVATEVGGANHNFSVIQLPVNLAMTEAVRASTQKVRGQQVSLLEAAHSLSISVVGSATLMQSQLASSLPDPIRSAFPGFTTDARRAIAFAQSLGIASALVGMKSLTHLEANLERGSAS